MSTPTVDFSIEVQNVLQRDEDDFIWFHPRATALPAAGRDAVLMTLQRHLQVSDHYSGLYVMRSGDLGRSWSGPEMPPELDWIPESDEITWAVADVTPGWHPQTRRCVAIGQKVRYDKGGAQIEDRPRSRETAYSAYDPATDRWLTWRMLDLPELGGKFAFHGCGCSQWLIRPDGSLLVPIYYRQEAEDASATTVLHCAFDGETMSYLGHGDELHLDVERGLCEPSLAELRGRYFLTLRNDERGYVTVSDDGLHFAPIRPWLFDDGSDLGSYNTQQHWLTHADALFLIYTRRGANNDHIVRHRAPLFIAQVDPERLCVVRQTERVLIPEQGAPLGNFGAGAINENESWVTVAEFMWPEWNELARSKGAAGRVLIARITWSG